MKTAGLTTRGYEPSVSLGILFSRCSGSLGGRKLRTLLQGNRSRDTADLANRAKPNVSTFPS